MTLFTITIKAEDGHKPRKAMCKPSRNMGDKKKYNRKEKHKKSYF